MKNIFLIGFMGTGKSTVARCMREKFHMEIIEMDELIAEREGMSIPEIFGKYGEEYFRDLETKFLVEIQEKDNFVVSCGGGIVLRQQNIKEMKKNGNIVLLTASPETILERVKYDNKRPLLRGKKNVEAIREMMEARRESYEGVADITIHIDRKGAARICKEIRKKLKRLENE